MRIRNFYMKVTLFGLLLIFCVMFGVSLATSGVERIQGALPSSTLLAGRSDQQVKALSLNTSSDQAGATKKKTDTIQEEKTSASAEQLAPDGDKSLNRVGNKLGDLLQIVAHHGIKLFVSLFDTVLGKG